MNRFLLRIVISIITATSAATSADDDSYSGSIVFAFSREAEQAVTRAEVALGRSDLTAGLNQLQAVLDEPADSLILRSGAYRSCWETANDLIAGLSQQQLSTYHRFVNEQSRQMLHAARQRNDTAALARLTDRYRQTPAGHEAAVQLAVLAADRGDLQRATEWLSFIDHSLPHAPASPLVDSIRRQVDEAHSGRSHPLSAQEKSGGANSVSVAHWRVEFGLSNSARRAITESLGEMDAQALHPIATFAPLVIGEHVVARTLSGVVCVETDTGKSTWACPLPSRVASIAGSLGDLDNPARWATISESLMRRIVRDSLQDEMSSDGQVLYLVVIDEDGRDRQTNELRAIDLATGQIVWQLGSRNSNQSRRTDDAEPTPLRISSEFFLGPPLVDGDRLLILTQRGDVITLLALDRHTGESQWAVPIGTAARDLKEDRDRRSLSCRLSKRGAFVYCPTGAGGLACFDVLRRRICWAYRSARSLPSGRLDEQTGAWHVNEMPTRDAWTATSAWWQNDRVIWVSAESDSLLVMNAMTGAPVWSEQRAEGLMVFPLGEDGLLIVESSRVSARNVTDGSLRWVTEIERIAGRGVMLNGRLVIPTLTGQVQIINLNDGTVEESTSGSPDERLPFRIETHPPRDLVPLALRNLATDGDAIISQAPGSLERFTLQGGTEERSTTVTGGERAILAHLLQVRTRLQPLVALLLETDFRIALADGALTTLFETTGLRRPATRQLAHLVHELEMQHAHGQAKSLEKARQSLQSYNLSKFSIVTDDRTRSCRLDRWLQSWERDRLHIETVRPERSRDDRSFATNAAHGCRSDAIEEYHPVDSHWPHVTPTVTEQDSTAEPVYAIRVPMMVTSSSPWNDVTVEVDRQVRSVWFHVADRRLPVRVRLPDTSDGSRLDPEYLHAWAPADVLVLRIGTELIAFRRTSEGELPTAPLWPSRGTVSLLGPRPPQQISIYPTEPEDRDGWNHASPGKQDRFERQVAEVGPVTADYLCFQQRGHVIALDTRTGIEIWRRSRLSLGARCLGDDEHVVLLHQEASRVSVLQTLDGRLFHEWDLPDSLAGTDGKHSGWAGMKLVRGSDGLFLHSEGRDVVLRVLDFSSGEVMWQRSFPQDSQVFAATGCFLGLAIPGSEDSSGNVQFLDWNTGESRFQYDGVLPAQMRDVFGFSDAQTQYVIVSDRITDRSLLRARQIHDGFRRPAVNGKLLACDRSTGALRWEYHLDNVAFPLDQPRHVPILVVNDVVQPDGKQTPTGRLTCIDKRTGDPLVSLSRPLHAYYSLEADASRGDISLQTRHQQIQFQYRGNKGVKSPHIE